MSGFRLEEEQLQIINETLGESFKRSYTREEAAALYDVFKEILRQAREMKIDYLKELEQVCKKFLFKIVLVRVDVFNEQWS